MNLPPLRPSPPFGDPARSTLSGPPTDLREGEAAQAAAQEGRQAGRRDGRDLLRVAGEQHEVQAISMGTEPLAPPEGMHGGMHREEDRSHGTLPKWGAGGMHEEEGGQILKAHSLWH